jgi:DNA (cytosine-5)-methyltransferase 1
MLADKDLGVKCDADHFNVTKVTTLNIHKDCYLKSDSRVVVKNINTGIEKEVDTSSFLNSETLKNLVNLIRSGKGRTFEIPEFNVIQDRLGISIVNGGNSNQKSDIVLDIHNSSFTSKDEGFGIKSYLGSKPTLLNASGNTNFIYRVTGIDNSRIDEINSINTRTKIKDRIEKIFQLGGELEFFKIEKDTMSYNLNMVDEIIPVLMSKMLLEFFVGRTSSISTNIKNVFNSGVFDVSDLTSLQVKVKRLLVSVLLGFFAGKKWDGKYQSKGTIVVKENGDQVGFHIVDIETLEDYLFENIKFDTPSSTRHRYGSLVIEGDQQAYFKLNLQLRF